MRASRILCACYLFATAAAAGKCDQDGSCENKDSAELLQSAVKYHAEAQANSLESLGQGARRFEFKGDDPDDLTAKLEKYFTAVQEQGWEEDMYMTEIYSKDGELWGEEYFEKYGVHPPHDHYPVTVVLELHEDEVGLLQLSSAQIAQRQQRLEQAAREEAEAEKARIEDEALLDEPTDVEKEHMALCDKNSEEADKRHAAINKDAASRAAWEASLSEDEKEFRDSAVETLRLLQEDPSFNEEDQSVGDEAAKQEDEDDESGEEADAASTSEDAATSGEGSPKKFKTMEDYVNDALKGGKQVGEDGIKRSVGHIINQVVEAEEMAETSADDLRKKPLKFPKNSREMAPFPKITEPDMGKGPATKDPKGWKGKGKAMMEEGTEAQMTQEEAEDNFQESMVGKNARLNVGAREAEAAFGPEQVKDIWEHRNNQLRLIEQREREVLEAGDQYTEEHRNILSATRLVALEEMWILRVKANQSVHPNDWPEGKPWIEFLESYDLDHEGRRWRPPPPLTRQNAMKDLKQKQKSPCDKKALMFGYMKGVSKSLIGTAPVCGRHGDSKNSIGWCTDERMHGRHGQHYRGCQDQTRSGRVCQSWGAQKPHKHRYGREGKHNMCRNPTGSWLGLWCYTEDPAKRWEQCWPKPEPDLHMRGMPSPRWRHIRDHHTDCDFLGQLECAGYCASMSGDYGCGQGRKPFNWECGAPNAHAQCVDKIFKIILAFFDFVMNIAGMALTGGAANAAKTALKTGVKAAVKAAKKGFARAISNGAKRLMNRSFKSWMKQGLKKLCKVSSAYLTHATSKFVQGKTMDGHNVMDSVKIIVGALDPTGIYNLVMSFTAEPCPSHAEMTVSFNGQVAAHQELEPVDWAMYHVNYGNRYGSCWNRPQGAYRDGYSSGCRTPWIYRGWRARVYGHLLNVKGVRAKAKHYHNHNILPPGFKGPWVHRGKMGGACCRGWWGRRQECRGKGPLFYHACS